MGSEADLLERDAELGELERLVRLVSSGSGGAVVIEGPPGIGKTRLLEAAAVSAEGAGLSVLRARPSVLERELGWGVVRDLFESRLRIATPKQRERLLTGAARFALPVLGHTGEVTLPRGPDGLAAALHGLYWLAANLADVNGLIITVDDAHWADGPSRRWLAYLAARISDLRAGLVLATRPAEPGSASGATESSSIGQSASVLRPPGLTESATAIVVAQALRSRVESGFARACLAATGGNPFFLKELLDELRRNSVLPFDVNANRVAMVSPQTIAALTLERVARLDPAAGKLVVAVAVLGTRVPLAEAGALARLSEEEAASAADALAGAGILTVGLPLEFVHPLVRAAVYERQPKAQMALRHRDAARLLASRGASDEAIAVHLLAVEPRADRTVVTRLLVAAESQFARGAPTIAARYLRRAMHEPPTSDQRPSIVYRLGQAEAASMGPAGLDALEEAVEITVAAEARAAIALEYSRAARMLAEFPKAVRVLQRVIESLGPDSPLAPRLDGELINVAILDLDTAAVARQRLARYRDPGLVEQLEDAGVLADLALTSATAGLPAKLSVGLARRALAAIDPEQPDPSATVFATSALLYCDEFDDASRAWDGFIVHARSTGSVLAYAFGCCFRAQLGHRIGRIREAEEDARAAVRIYSDWSTKVVESNSFLAEVLVERGAVDEAAQLLGFAAPGDLPRLWQYTVLLHARGRVRLHQNKPVEALADLRECGTRLRGASRNPSILPWRSQAALALLQLRRPEEAIALAREELRLAEAFGAPRAIGVAMRVAGIVEGGGIGLRLLQDATDVLKDARASVEHARASYSLGASLRRTGHPKDARAPLRSALDLARRSGADGLAEQARAELLAAGGRPRRDRIEGRDALTPSELRVATMAADGMSNPEIAQSLFVTLRTVETHLSHVYRKLSIASRAELQCGLEQSARPDE